MLDRSVAARRFVIQTLDRLLAQSAKNGPSSAAADRREQNTSGSDQLLGSLFAGSRN
ncbi:MULTISPECIES: hypothetical protein [unclassified Rhizobium]|uniref:hypothetical protein n=1 Tax=unclassified Rhizobium TaxID=2613769 RepID=UPI000A654439|nr:MULTISPECIES: hypothetical protein [unclassified Rhizobium]TCM57546.1 hypothetical protein C8J36_102346 [Rhizobium sp. PP-F2F-G48]